MVKYDIYLVRFPHDEHDGTSSLHPALVLDNSKVAIMSMISSKVDKYNGPTDYHIIDFYKAGLTLPSVIRLSKIESITPSNVINQIGHLTKKDIAGVEKILGLNESIEKHDNLNPAIWDGDKLKPEVREKLLQIVDMFKQNLIEDDIDLDVKDVYLLGSNAGYNYTKDSDIDCHIMADFSSLSDEVDLVDKLYQARKSLWNDKYDPVINGFDVELYVEPYEEVMEEEVLDEANSSGVYSIMNNTWVKVPNKNDAEVKDVSDQVAKLTSEANACQEIEQIDDFMDGVYKMRQEALLNGGEFSEGNLVFKELRNNGVLQDLKDRKVKLMNDLMSLGER